MIEILTISEPGTGSYVEHKFVLQETMTSIYEFEKAIIFNLGKIF